MLASENISDVEIESVVELVTNLEVDMIFLLEPTTEALSSHVH